MRKEECVRVQTKANALLDAIASHLLRGYAKMTSLFYILTIIPYSFIMFYCFLCNKQVIYIYKHT